MKPVRTFSANVGQRSVSQAGPDYLENDLDNICKMFDPNLPDGGIGAENIKPGAINATHLNKISITATEIPNSPSGNIQSTTVQQAINELDAEKVPKTDTATSPEANKLLYLNANAKLPASVTGDADATVAKLEAHKVSSDHDSYNDTRYYTKTQLQTAGQAQVHWGNLTNIPNLADSSWKPAVASYTSLPTTGNAVNDMRVVVDDGDGKSAIYRCKATSGTREQQWEKLADLDWTNDHSKLVNLTNDDHPQYLNNARGDVRYYQKSEVNTLLAGKSDTTHNHDSVYVKRSGSTLTGDLDFAGFKAKNMVEDQGIAFPSNPVIGQRFYRTDLAESYLYKGVSAGWIKVSGRGAVPRRESFTASINGAQKFTLTTGKYEVGTNSLLVFRNGQIVPHTENSMTEFTITVVNGDSVVAWYLENSPEVVNTAVQKDGTLQSNLNADMLDGKHLSDVVQKAGDSMQGTLSMGVNSILFGDKFAIQHNAVSNSLEIVVVS